MQYELQTFTDSIMRLSAPAISMLGTNMPGIAGNSAAQQGAMTSAADEINQLKLKTASFQQAFLSHDHEHIGQISEEVEGHLLTLRTLSVINDDQLDNLLDQLSSLTAHGKA